LNLNGSVAAADFRIDRGEDKTNFANQVWVDYRCRVDAGWPPSVLDHDTVAHRGDVCSTDAGKGRAFAAECGVRLILNSGQHANQLQHVVANHRQIRHTLLAQHLTDRGAGRRQNRVTGNAHFHLCADSRET
jgi:hypothetical protein